MGNQVVILISCHQIINQNTFDPSFTKENLFSSLKELALFFFTLPHPFTCPLLINDEDSLGSTDENFIEKLFWSCYRGYKNRITETPSVD